MSSETKGASGLCQQITPNATNHYLSFWAYEGGTDSAFKTADQEADNPDSTGTTVQSTLFSELNCFYLPTQIGSGSFPTSKCEREPSLHGDAAVVSGRLLGPARAVRPDRVRRETVTLFVGVWDFFTDAGPTVSGNGIFIGNVQLTRRHRSRATSTATRDAPAAALQGSDMRTPYGSSRFIRPVAGFAAASLMIALAACGGQANSVLPVADNAAFVGAGESTRPTRSRRSRLHPPASHFPRWASLR